MNLCSDNHDEVCYEGRKCPVCDMREDLQGSIDDLQKEIEELNNQIE
jgi:hypothetical protein